MSDMFLNFSAFVQEESQSPLVFGLRVSTLDVAGVAAEIAHGVPSVRSGARLFVTPNIQHVSLMRRDAELREAMGSAELVTCDGFPVARYAKMRGCVVPGRVTGREVVDELLNRTDLSNHRLSFLVDSAETAAAVEAWATSRQGRPAVQVEIAPQGFGKDDDYCAALAGRIAAFGATMLFLGVGAPRSEMFAARYRDRLPDGCWVLCIGQSIKIALGLDMAPPPVVRALNVEWLWRMVREPRRLVGRYCDGAVGFVIAAAEEMSGPSIVGKVGTLEAAKGHLAMVNKAER